jgi:antitoxin ParD1/3/4
MRSILYWQFLPIEVLYKPEGTMPTRNVNLTDHFDHFIDSRIGSGHFSNASEVVREGLRLLEQRDAEDRAKLAWLRSAAEDSFAAIDRGEGTKFHSLDDLAALIDQTSGSIVTKSRRG